MAVEYRDYYAVLGVPRDATGDDIKKAFRKLARQYHPDVAKDKKTAEAKFKEINEAHEVLSDPVKRRKYDELGADWQSGREQAPSPGSQWRSARAGSPREEYHFGGTGFSDFFEQFFGGGGRDPDIDELFRSAQRQSADSGNRGYAVRGQDIEGDILVTLHEAVHGATRTISLQRTNPTTGERSTDTIHVRVPPGAQEGRRIRVPNKGGPGTGGAAAGDLYLRVRLAAHPDFEVRGSDLYYELVLAPWEPVLGAEIVVPTLSGSVKLRVAAGSDTGRQLRIKGQGLLREPGGARGDLYVVIRIAVPTEVSASERKAWEELARVSKFSPRESS